VEFIHAFSLVHDDLPALDNDDLRRGMPTLHIHSGEAMAILAGDALMAMAFDILDRQTPDPSLTRTLIAELSSATMGMIAGQVYDTLGGLSPNLADRERLELIHRKKTGALIRAACRMGAILGTGKADDPRMGAITRYAECVGLLFQIVDDLLDVESSPEQAGKRTKKDAKAGKVTYPALLGLDGSRREVTRLHTEALAALEPLGGAANGLRSLARAVADRRS
jgi:geranylgeranyl pyrophosphate synthase